MGIKSVKQQGLGGLDVTALKAQGNLATGGSVATLNGYRIHTFTSTGTFCALVPLNVEYLIVAGGGSAGSAQYHSGGGGAGGVLQGSCFVNSGTYTVTVGAGGTCPTASTTRGNNGSNSSFNGLTATGGGGAGVYSNTTGLNGGSGGGGGAQASVVGSAGTGVAGQGYNGGAFDGAASGTKHGGGGGGAGGAGTTGGNSTGGNGGIGIASMISGTLKYYAGGGAGSTEYSTGVNTGGLGGGGNGNYNTGENGTTNTGGGGGGGERISPTTSGSGGSGIVIIRYKVNSNAPTLSNPIVTDGLIYSIDADNIASYTTTANIVGAKIYSVFGNVAGATRSSNYTVQYSDDNSSWTTAFTGVMSNNGNCGIQIGSGTGDGSYRSHRYWRYVEGAAVVNHHPRCSRIMLTDINGIDYVIIKYVDDNKADTGTYIIGTVTVDLASRWHDLSVSNNSAGLSNSPTYSSNNGGYIQFNGSSQNLSIGSILNAYPFTVSFWAQQSNSWSSYTLGAMEELLNMSIASQRVSIGIANVSGWTVGPTLMYGGTNHWTCSNAVFTDTSKFYNVVWVVYGSNDSNHKIYVNGVSQTMVNNGGAHGGTAGWSIASNSASSEYWPGKIASVQVYNKTLSQLEVNQNFNALRGKFGI